MHHKACGLFRKETVGHCDDSDVGLFSGGEFELRAGDQCSDGEVGNKGEDLEPGHPNIIRGERGRLNGTSLLSLPPHHSPLHPTPPFLWSGGGAIPWKLPATPPPTPDITDSHPLGLLIFAFI